MADLLYGDLIYIERRRRNEISAGSDARNRFDQAITSRKPSSVRINCVLKTLRMAIRFEAESKRPNAANIRACRLWMSALASAAGGSMERDLFVRLPLDDKLKPEFETIDEADSRLENKGGRRRGNLALFFTVFCIALFSACVLYWHFDFYFCLFFMFLFLNFGLWLILCVSRLRAWYVLLDESRKQSGGSLRSFLEGIRLRKISYSPLFLYRLARLQLRRLFG